MARISFPLQAKCHNRLSQSPLALHSATFASWQSQRSCSLRIFVHECASAWIKGFVMCSLYFDIFFFFPHDVLLNVSLRIAAGKNSFRVKCDDRSLNQHLWSFILLRATSARHMLAVTRARTTVTFQCSYQHCDVHPVYTSRPVLYTHSHPLQLLFTQPPRQSFHIDSDAYPVRRRNHRAAADRDKNRGFIFPP